MHLSFLQFLQCPQSGEALQLIEVNERQDDFILEGILASNKYEYPIVRGIPRFAGYTKGNYSKSFGYQWNKWSRVQFESENINGPMKGHTSRMFERIIGSEIDDMEGKLILDVGCGSGRFIDMVRRKKGRAIGIDYSAAVEAARANFPMDKNVLICQADALNLPIRLGVMDGAFSIGVLHHTPDPQLGFKQMVNTVKAGRWVAISVYGKGGYYDSPRVTVWRMFFKILAPVFRYKPSLIYAYIGTYAIYPLTKIPILGHLLRLVYPTVRLPDPHWRLLDTFDSVTPAHQSSHESYEVYSWFRDVGMVEIEPSNWGFTAYHGKVLKEKMI